MKQYIAGGGLVPPITRPVCGALAGLCALGLALSAGSAGSARAAELPNEFGATVFFDTTLTAGASFRMSGRDHDLIAVINGGNANSANGDDGNLNYDNGDAVSANVKVTHELSMHKGDWSFFGRAFYFHDEVGKNGDTRRTRLPGAADEHIGSDFELLDAYATHDTEINGQPATFRFGNQVISWGESVFIRNGLNSINPVDVSQFRVAGAELRDGLVPVPAVDFNLGLSDHFSLEGFYQLQWDHSEIEPSGSYFSTNDFASPGGEFAHLGWGRTAEGFLAVPRSRDRDADHGGQAGLALRYFSPQLNDTEFGFYYARIHSRLPLISGTTGDTNVITPAPPGNPAAAIVGALRAYDDTARYYREFPEDIDLFGMSFNTEIGRTGLAFQGEISYRKDQPLQVDDVELLFAALSPVEGVLRAAGSLTGLPPGLPGYSRSQLCTARAPNGDCTSFGSNQDIAGYRRKDVVQAQLALVKSFGPSLGASQTILLTEVGATQVQDMERKSELRYDGPGTNTSGHPGSTGLQPARQTDGFADEFSWGYRILARATYNNVIGSLSLTPQIAFAHDVDGTTPGPIGNFLEDRKTTTLSLRANYLNSFEASIAYTDFSGGGQFNLVNDRDFLSLTVRQFF